MMSLQRLYDTGQQELIECMPPGSFRMLVVDLYPFLIYFFFLSFLPFYYLHCWFYHSKAG